MSHRSAHVVFLDHTACFGGINVWVADLDNALMNGLYRSQSRGVLVLDSSENFE
jgi:hypothetical protein